MTNTDEGNDFRVEVDGTERFNVAMQSGGRDSVEGDWAFISGFESFEVGLDQLGILANTCGWGRWSIISLDREAKVARFRVTNGWEALYQSALGVDWGSNMLAGKFAGSCSKLVITPLPSPLRVSPLLTGCPIQRRRGSYAANSGTTYLRSLLRTRDTSSPWCNASRRLAWPFRRGQCCRNLQYARYSCHG